MKDGKKTKHREPFERDVVGEAILWVKSKKGGRSGIEKVLIEANRNGGVIKTPFGNRLENDFVKWLLNRVNEDDETRDDYDEKFAKFLPLDDLCESDPDSFWVQFDTWFHNSVSQHVRLAVSNASSFLTDLNDALDAVSREDDCSATSTDGGGI